MHDKHELYDIYGMWHTPFWQSPLFLTFIGIIFLIILFWGIFLGIRWFLKKNSRPLSAWEKAEQDIASLKVKYLKKEIKVSEVYVELLGSLKVFFTVQYGIDMRSKTDDESLPFLQDLSLSDTVKEKLEELFKRSAVIKFSFMQISEELVLSDLDLCSAVIQESVSHATKR